MMLCLPHPPSRRHSGFLLLSFLQVPNWRSFILFLTVILLWLLPSLPSYSLLTPSSASQPTCPADPGEEDRGSGSSTSCWCPSSWPPVETHVKAGLQLLPLGVPFLGTAGGEEARSPEESWVTPGPEILILKGFQEHRDGSRSFSFL